MCDDISDHCYGVFMADTKCVINKVVASLKDENIRYIDGRVDSCNQ